MKEFPNNKTSNFSVNLPKMIALDGEFEVAVVEAIYTNTIENVTKNNNRLIYQYKTLKKNKQSVLTKEISFELEIGHYKKLDDILQAINQKVSNYTENTVDELFSISMNGKLACDDEQRDKLISKLNIEATKIDRDAVIVPHRLFFENSLSVIFGFNPYTHNLIKDSSAIHLPSIKFGISGEILIYINIIEPIIFGHK